MTNARDLHNALKSEVVETKSVPNFQLALAKLQWGKTDFGYSVHINSNTWISSGIQGKELLEHLGLEHCACSFLQGECWAKSVPEGFDLSAFASTLNGAFNGMREAEKKLEACGLRLVERESRRGYYGRGSDYYGDGHTSAGTPNKMKESNDDHFDFVFTFQDSEGGKGWTTHRHPKSQEITPDFIQALNFLGLQKMAECPQFDFEECYWSFIPYTGRDFDDGNTNWAHGSFDKHTTNFSETVHQLASVNAMLEPHGLSIFDSQR